MWKNLIKISIGMLAIWNLRGCDSVLRTNGGNPACVPLKLKEGPVTDESIFLAVAKGVRSNSFVDAINPVPGLAFKVIARLGEIQEPQFLGFLVNDGNPTKRVEDHFETCSQDDAIDDWLQQPLYRGISLIAVALGRNCDDQRENFARAYQDLRGRPIELDYDRPRLSDADLGRLREYCSSEEAIVDPKNVLEIAKALSSLYWVSNQIKLDGQEQEFINQFNSTIIPLR